MNAYHHRRSSKKHLTRAAGRISIGALEGERRNAGQNYERNNCDNGCYEVRGFAGLTGNKCPPGPITCPGLIAATPKIK